MHYQICYEQRLDKITSYALERFPNELRTRILEFLIKNHLYEINEIRLHRNSVITFIASSKNVRSDIKITSDELAEVMTRLCSGSIYAHFDTIKEGYISLGKGIRAGICGKANVEYEKITAISEISSINIRLPRRIPNSADYLFKLLMETNFQKSVLLYSRPGVGKTTILRELIYSLCSQEPPIRHAVIDSREEITPFMEDELLSSDIFVSYPKGIAIEIATKSMTPEMIICDEISSFDEALAVMKAANNGVVMVATCHADTFEELCSKEILQGLFSHNVFNYALGIKRENGTRKYEFSLNCLDKKL